MNDTSIWVGEVRWIGPPIGRAMAVGSGRIWRWSEAESQTPGLGFPARSGALRGAALVGGMADPPGALEPGLALFDASGGPVVALGRHPVLQPAGPGGPAWIRQHVLTPSPGADEWTPWLVFEEDPRGGGLLLDSTGRDLGRVANAPRRGGRARNARDTVTVASTSYHQVPIEVGGARGWRRHFGAAPQLVGLSWIGVIDGLVRLTLRANRADGFDGRVSAVVSAVWASEPGADESALALSCLATAIDGDHDASMG